MYEQELAVAGALADEADEIAQSLYGTDLEVRSKDDRTPVTEADLRVEAMIRERLGERFPADAIHGEEEGLSGDGPRTWVIDPIDGTKNYAAGIQIWATLIALLVDGDPVVGVVSAPALGERYAAAEGEGATLNGRPIRVSGVGRLDEAFVLTDGSAPFLSDHRAWFTDLALQAQRTRGFGDFWAHMLVARGAADVELAPEVRLWDYAALVPVVREAGGRVSAFDGGPLSDGGTMVATNGALHDLVLEAIGSGRETLA
jgi:histidinol-phosphatase